ncbi:MAG: sulfatase [Myxococcota bacterium]|nr:sulfatase [Myxococcota bacterium]
MVSRGLRLGLGLALLGWAGLALLDGTVSALGAPLDFESLQERLWFATLVGLAPLGPAVVLGLCQGALGLAVLWGARRLSRSTAPHRTAPWVGRLVALLAAPGVAAVCAQVFRGPRAQRLPGKDLWAVLLGLLALFLLSQAVPCLLALVRWADEAGPRRRSRSLLCSAVLAALAVLTYAADRLILPRLYPWFHLSLLVLYVALAQGAGLFAVLGAGWLRRCWLNQDAVAPAVALLAVALGGWGLLRLDRAAVLRAAALEHARLASPVLWLHSRLNPPPALTEQAGGDSPAGTPVRVGPRLPDADVFLITVDALRDDRLAPQTMPFAASLAARGVRFVRAYTQVPHTSFAVATLLTGKPVYALLQLGQDAAAHDTLPLVLRRARYRTAAFYPPSVFYIEHERLRRLEESAYGFEYIKYEYLGARQRTQQLIDYLETERPQRVFAWVHYLEPHEPYEPHPGGPGRRASDRERYDGEVRVVDDEIARLVTYLRAGRPGAVLVLASDHGEEFGEHGGRYHGTTLYEEQVRVPLVLCDLHDPPRFGPARVETPVGLIDVAPTLLGLLDITPSARMRGRDLGPFLQPGAPMPPVVPVFAEIGRRKMVVLGDHKLICDLATDACSLYDLRADPQERRSRYGADPVLTQRLRSELARHLAEVSRYEKEAGEVADLDARAREALRRGRLGDPGAAPDLVHLLTRGSGAGRREAARLLAELCVGPAAAAACGAPDAVAALRQAAAGQDLETRRWAEVALALGDDGQARRQMGPIILDPQAEPALRLAAALALGPAAPDGIDRVPLWAEVLPAAMELDDPDRVRPLLRLLGASRDRRALPALRAQLDNVRSRADVVAALGELGPPAVPDLARLLRQDPYVPVRAAAAGALGRIGGPAARAALQAARRTEREPLVRTAIEGALRGGALAPRRGRWLCVPWWRQRRSYGTPRPCAGASSSRALGSVHPWGWGGRPPGRP